MVLRDGLRRIPWQSVLSAGLIIAGMIAWGVRNESKISALQIEHAEVRRTSEQILIRLEALAQRITIADERLATAQARNLEQDQKIERMDQHGTRALLTQEERLKALDRRLDSIGQYLNPKSVPNPADGYRLQGDGK